MDVNISHGCHLFSDPVDFYSIKAIVQFAGENKVLCLNSEDIKRTLPRIYWMLDKFWKNSIEV